MTEPLKLEHIKPRLLGHWGTTPGLNLIYAHTNRVIKERDFDAIYVMGPGHGGPEWNPVVMNTSIGFTRVALATDGGGTWGAVRRDSDKRFVAVL